MTDIEKIQDEVKRLMREYKNESEFRTVRSDTAKEFGGKILDFISSMEPEPMKQSESFLDQIQEYDTEEVVCHDLESFGEGEIVYAIETQDYFAALFKIPSNWHGEDYFETEVAINMNGEWVYSKCDSFYLEEEQWYRMATEDEIKMFNEMAKKA